MNVAKMRGSVYKCTTGPKLSTKSTKLVSADYMLKASKQE